MSRIEDVTMNLLLAGKPQLFYQDGWSERLQVSFHDTGNAMKESEVESLSDGIRIDTLKEYRIAIGMNTQEIVKQLHPSELQQKVDPARLKRVIDEKAMRQEACGLLDYWGGLTYGGLLLMPLTRHNFIHLNEAQRIKLKIQKKPRKGD
jgi:hypothetical protein